MMKLKSCNTSHFISTIRDGIIIKVHNTDSQGKPALKFKKLEDIYQFTYSEYISRSHDDYPGTEFNGSNVEIDHAHRPLLERNTGAGNSYLIEEDEPECPSSENIFEEQTLSQLMKKWKRKKRKASEAVRISNIEDDDSDLGEPLCKFRVKAVKRSKFKAIPAIGSLSPSFRSTSLVTSDSALLFSKDHATVTVKVEPEVKNLKCRDVPLLADDNCNGRVNFIASESGFIVEIMKSGFFTNEGEFGLHEVSLDDTSKTEPVNFFASESGSIVESMKSGSYTNEGEFDINEVSFDNSSKTEPVIFLASESGFIVKSVKSGFFTDEGEIGLNEVSLDDSNETEPVNFIASESGFIGDSMKSGSFTNEGGIGLNEVSLDKLTEIENTFAVPSMGEEKLVLVDEENIANVGLPLLVSEVDKEECVNHNQPPLNASFLEDSFPVEDMMARTSNCIQNPNLQQASDQSNYIHGFSELTANDDNPYVDLGLVSDICMVDECAESSPTNQECGSPNMMHDDDDFAMFMEAKSPNSEEKQLLTSENAEAEAISLDSDNIYVVSEETPTLQEQPSFVSANADPEVTPSNHNYQTDMKRQASEIKNSDGIELRHSERLPSTRKAISPTSQEKLCLAMKSPEFLDDMDSYKCKEKLCFEEPAENKCSSTSSDVENNELNVNPQQATQLIQNKAVITPRHHKKSKNHKKGNLSKGCLDGSRLCRSIPRLSTGCTSIRRCSESAIAFSQRQMHDIETLASKLMDELNSMKAIVGEKMVYEAHCSTSLKNEADKVKSAIKSATKTEESARRWLSMMARDCNRFCKIMKLKEDNNTTASDTAVASTNQEKPLPKDKKKISFADEAGGTLCDIKIFQSDGDLQHSL